jgi:hypothetical protein
MDLKEIQKMALDAKNTLANVQRINSELISKLPTELNDKKQELIEDINKVTDLVNKSDISGLNDLLKKYADNNSK